MGVRLRAAVAVLLAVGAAALAPGAGSAHAARAPAVSAPSAILVEASTGDVLYARDAEERRAIASTTKLMTALLTLERARKAELVPASSYVASPLESRLGLRPGERLSVADLLRGLMLESANDAAVTLAEHVGGTRAAFVRLMNRRARQLGLTRTHFANPIGLDAPGNHASAHDLARLAVVLRGRPFIRRLADRTRAVLRTGARPRVVRNRNTLLSRDPHVDGLKTGHTSQAGYVLVGTRTRRGVTLVAVVLGTASTAARDADTLSLLRWGAGRYRRVRPVERGTVVGTPGVRDRPGITLRLVTMGSVTRVLPAGTRVSWHDVGVPREVVGPVARGRRFGYREVFADGQRIAAVPIVAASALRAPAAAPRTEDDATRTLALLGGVLVLGGAVLATRRGRRRPGRRSARSEPEAA